MAQKQRIADLLDTMCREGTPEKAISVSSSEHIEAKEQKLVRVISTEPQGSSVVAVRMEYVYKDRTYTLVCSVQEGAI